MATVGNSLYFIAGFPSVIAVGKWILLFSRFLLGLAAGSLTLYLNLILHDLKFFYPNIGILSVVRAYVVEVSTTEDRTGMMAIQTATQYFGFAVMPLLGALFASFGDISIGGFYIDDESMPSFIMSFICFLTMIIVATTLREPDTTTVVVPVKQHLVQHIQQVPIYQSSKEAIVIFCVFLSLNLFTRMALSVIETLGGVIFSKLFTEFSSSTVVEASGVYYGILGIIGTVLLISIVFISKKLRDFNLLLFGLVVMTIGFLALMSDKLSKTRFVFGSAIVWTIGFPLAQTLVVSMFSKKIRSRKQVRRTMISFWCIAKELTLKFTKTRVQ